MVTTNAVYSYANVAQYRGAIDAIDPGKDALIEDDLEAVSRVIDKECGRYFFQDAAASARLYYPTNPRYLLVGDISTRTGLVIKANLKFDGDYAAEPAFDTTDYQLQPLNADTDNPAEPRPWDTIFLPAFVTSKRYFWLPGQEVQVTARWGWSAVPKAIQRWCIELAGILRLETPRATRQVNDIGVVLGMSSQGSAILDRLRDTYGRGPTL